MRASFRPGPAAIALFALTSACEQPLRACNYNFVYGRRIAVTDSSTGMNLAGQETIVEVRDGAYVDTVPQATPTEYQGAGERPGTYSIKVQRQGFGVWQNAGIRVGEDECHVIPVLVNARLQPL